MLRAVATQKAPVLLAASAVAASVTGTTNETALATVTIPAGAMGTNGGLEVRTTWTVTNSANGKTLRVRFGGAAGTAYLNVGVTTTATVPDTRRIRNRNSASSQVGSIAPSSLFAIGSGAVTTSSVDTTANVDLVISGQLVNSGESITLEHYEVWLLPGT